ncbi:MAG: RNA polymerase-binding protein DksA [Gammaproteobacteria bacterium]
MIESPLLRSSTADTHSTETVSSKVSHVVAGLEGIEPYKANVGEEYMNEEQVKHFRFILESMRQQLMEDVDRTVNDMRDSDKNLSDFTDRATNEEEMFFMLRTRTREGKLLKKIEEALDRLEHHDYGFCDTCGVEIGVRRLEARPTATLCIDCKTLDEIREKQRSG